MTNKVYAIITTQSTEKCAIKPKNYRIVVRLGTLRGEDGRERKHLKYYPLTITYLCRNNVLALINSGKEM